jgi:hypothetical protein
MPAFRHRHCATALAGGAVLLLVSGCAPTLEHGPVAGAVPAAGTLTGTVLREGGALGPNGSQPKAVPMDATVSATRGSRMVARIKVTGGRFTLSLPPGTYTVTAVTSGSGTPLHCAAASSATVTSMATTTTAVDCIVP